MMIDHERLETFAPMLKSLLRRGLGLLGLAAVGGCTTAPTEAAQAKPALWQVSDADTTVYLFGTIHLLPPNYQWRTPKLEEALGKSQALVVETVVDDKNPQAFMEAMGRLGFSPGQPPIADRVSAEKRPLLDAAIARSRQPREVFDRMETWAAAFMLLGAQFQQLGLSGEEGVETVLRKEFTGKGRPIDQLESNSDQLDIFDRLPEKDQRAFLESVIEEPESMRKQFGAMLAAWTRGDIDAIARTFNQDLGSSPAMMEALIQRRNMNWSRWVERRLDQPGTAFLAVGAGHLAGQHSVVTMLQKDGYRVTRIQ
jgi:uncharacterized protein YbaP (TraB family)